MNELPTSELQSRGYSPSEISTIRNAETLFDEHIEQLSTLPDDNLGNLGYSASQIQDIRSFDTATATSTEKALLSATCTVTSTIDNYTGTTGRVTTEFEWNGVPAFKMVDILATAWNNWYITGKTAYIQYADINGNNNTFWQTPTYMLPDSGLESYGSGYRFNAALQDNYYYARNGYSIFVLGRASTQHLETIGRLGHQQGVASLSFSTDGVSIGFTIGRVSLGNGHDIEGN